jgi:peptidoglycan/LPS O-acetylase OafA/YrhL
LLQQQTTNKILPLTSLRFLAAFFVVLYHSSSTVPWLRQPDFSGRLVALGYISVSFFFFLSGFVLALAYLRPNKPLNVPRFLTARFARIYPALFACLLFDLPHFLYAETRVNHHGGGLILTEILVSFTALEGWFPHLSLLDTPSWSIAAEFFFYLVFPFTAPWLWRLRARFLWTLAAVLYLGGNLLVLAFAGHPEYSATLDRNPLAHLPEFLLGICLARLFVFISDNAGWSAFSRRFALPIATLSGAVFLAIPAFSLHLSEPLLQHTLLVPLFALTILAFASGNKILTTLFAPNWFVVLGEASFALYLIHMPLAMIFRRMIQGHSSWFPFLYFAIAIALSVASFFWLETPARKWILSRTHASSREDLTTQAVAQ